PPPHPHSFPTRRSSDLDDAQSGGPSGTLVMPGKYKVSMAKRVSGVLTPLAGSQEFTVYVEGASQMKPEDRAALVEFQKKVARLQDRKSTRLNSSHVAIS